MDRDFVCVFSKGFCCVLFFFVCEAKRGVANLLVSSASVDFAPGAAAVMQRDAEVYDNSSRINVCTSSVDDRAAVREAGS